MNQRDIVDIEYFIPLEDLERECNGTYFTELDIVAGVRTDNTVWSDIIHPFSTYADGAILRNAIKEEMLDDKPIIPYGFLIVDHEKKWSPRFLRIGENIYQIPTCNNRNLAEGFHVTTPRNFVLRSEIDTDHSRVLSMEDADKEFRLTLTYEDAMVQDSVLSSEAKFQEMELRNKQVNHSAEELNYKRDFLELQREMDKLKREHEESERNHKREMREHVRRREYRGEWLDIAKTALGLLTTGFLIYKAFKYK